MVNPWKPARSLLFALVSTAALASALILAYNIQVSTLGEDTTYTFTDFLNDGKTIPSTQDILVGLTFGIVFGSMDTLGTWIGMKETSGILPGVSSEFQAAVAGTYSNIMSLTIGTLITLIARQVLKTEDEQKPIWVNVLGILIGSCIGIATGATFLSGS